MFQKLLLMVLTATTASVLPAQAWFVRAGAQDGDGTQSKPFSDPWQALERCQAGDAIHVAEGKYFGKLGVGMWEIPFDRVQILGGYNKEFTVRNPWAHLTELLWDKNSKNRPNQGRLVARAKDTVIDGIVIDMRDQSFWRDPECSGRTDKQGDPAISLWHPATVRNCVVINSGQECVTAKPGAVIENNLFLNSMVFAVKIDSGPEPKAVAVIRNNTILFPWDIKSPGTGNFRGSGIFLGQGTNADITGNILAHCDNVAVHSVTDLGRTSLTKNAFAMNLFGNLLTGAGGASATIDDKTMELLEEAGLKAFDGNVVANAELPLDPAWMDKYSKRTASKPGKVVMDDWNKLRQLCGLPLIGTGYQQADGVAPPYELSKAVQLVTGRKDKLPQGARVQALECKFATAAPAAVAKQYDKVEIQSWNNAPETVNGKDFEMLVAISTVANISTIPASYKKEDHSGIYLHDIEGKGVRVIGFFKKGTNAERLVDADQGNYRGRDKPSRVHLVRGTALAVPGVPKAAFCIDSIERFEDAAPTTAAADARPRGRDWFVKAGATGGDGNKDKPFRDPFQALEKAQAGDSIHVAEGEYYGKLRGGRWKIECAYLALLGGYDPEFTERAPWSRPTRLVCPQDFKGTRGGYTIEGDGDHTGLIVDGFVFDKQWNNNYGPDGNLIDQFTDHSEHVRINRPGCVVRNCVFVNGAEGAVTAANGQTVENNVFMNHVSWTLALTAGHTTAPAIVRNNTMLFSWERANRFGKGMGYGGEAITTVSNVRAVIDNNIIQFSDNNAIRFNADAKDVKLTNNVFAQNLWSILYRTENIVDDATFAQLSDFGLAAATGNQLLVPGIPLDAKWFDVYLNRTALVPGKVKMDGWNQVREILGQPMIATGGTAGTGRAPAYDWKQAMAMLPKNAQCKAGARPFREVAKFTGVARVDASAGQDYAETTWDVAKSADAWNALDGKRVALKIAVDRVDNQFFLEDVKKEEYECFTVVGPLGIDSGGQALRCYVKRGSTAERVLQKAKGSPRGVPDELHLLKGIARGRRTMVVEAAAKTD